MTTANQSTAERNITLVSVANIQPSNYNPRKRFDETGLDELSESIKQQGFHRMPSAINKLLVGVGFFRGSNVFTLQVLRDRHFLRFFV